MLLYRALIDDDTKELKKANKISCTLKRTYDDLDNAKNIARTKEIYKKCYIDKNKTAIYSLVFGHVSGKLVAEAKRSPWISLTSSFKAAYKYSNLDQKNRRKIICIDVPDNTIINNASDTTKLDITSEVFLNLSDGKLIEYRKEGIINAYGEVPSKKPNCRNFMINSYSKGDNEYLKCYELVPENYILLGKNEQDILINYSEQDIEQYVTAKLNQNNISKQKRLKKK